jgi:ComF family protein
MEFIGDPQCNLCGFPFDFDAGPGISCGSCNLEPPFFDKALSIFKYSSYSKSLILKLKYNDQLYIGQFLAKLLSDKSQNLHEYRLVIPVPLHAKKLRQRLYNQSAIIASHVAKLSRRDFLPNILIKKRYDIPQNQLNRERRKTTILNSFEVSKENEKFIKGKNIILIDDVYTTGSTVNECSKTLKKAGAGKILVITAARVV